jgi:hypothetical protein
MKGQMNLKASKNICNCTSLVITVKIIKVNYLIKDVG